MIVHDSMIFGCWFSMGKSWSFIWITRKTTLGSCWLDNKLHKKLEQQRLCLDMLLWLLCFGGEFHAWILNYPSFHSHGPVENHSFAYEGNVSFALESSDVFHWAIEGRGTVYFCISDLPEFTISILYHNIIICFGFLNTPRFRIIFTRELPISRFSNSPWVQLVGSQKACASGTLQCGGGASDGQNSCDGLHGCDKEQWHKR